MTMMCLFCWLTFGFHSQQYQDQEEEEGESDDDDVQFFTLIVRMGEENLSRFLDEARNNPETLREFMMRFL